MDNQIKNSVLTWHQVYKMIESQYCGQNKKWNGKLDYLHDDIIQHAAMHVHQFIGATGGRPSNNLCRYAVMNAIEKLMIRYRPAHNDYKYYYSDSHSDGDTEAAKIFVKKIVGNMSDRDQMLLTGRLAGHTFADMAPIIGNEKTVLSRRYNKIIEELRGNDG